MRKFGLIGYPLGHSFSRKYFSEKFIRESIGDVIYSNFEIDAITRLPDVLKDPELEGLNITIPYKQSVLPFLHEMDPVVSAIGACNCIRIKNGNLKGYNTDVVGFEKSLDEKLKITDRKALILGTGGSSKAVAWVLKKKGLDFLFVTRKNCSEPDHILYSGLNHDILHHHTLIINTTPLGMYPNTDGFPELPYEFAGAEHYFFDLVYNPSKTLFLEKAAARGARIKNGADMLAIQAEASWEIWDQA